MANIARITQSVPELITTQNGTARITQDAIEFVTGAGISCGSPPQGILGRFYSHTLVFGGGTPPYAFAIIAGALPTGLSVGATDGVISGIPSVVGIFTFTVQITDSMGTVSSVSCSIQIIQTFSAAGGGTPVMGCQCCPPVKFPFKYRRLKTEWNAVPVGAVHVQRRGGAEGPVNTTPVVLCEYQVPTNRRFQLDALVAIAQTINGWNFGDGNVIFAVTISRAPASVSAQGMPWTADLGSFTIPLGSLATPWLIPRTTRLYAESREIVRLMVQTDPVFIAPGPDTQFLGLLQGYEWGVE